MWLMMMVGAAVVFAWLCVFWRGRAVLIGEASTLVRYLRRKVARAFFIKTF